jgi:Mg-chelatase subunit ChlI
MTTRKPHYPFSAIVGQDALKTVLMLTAIDPGLGGVLIRGEKGTGKTTAVRGLYSILPSLTAIEGCPYGCPPDDPGLMCDSCRSRISEGDSVPLLETFTPLVELPLNTTEDRLVGTLHLEKTLREGRRHFEPGLLARAHRGVLYVDEVNLLEDHLVDLLLDVAASGINIVEREGISVTHPSRFSLIGTMNPEEGELRPQFLDRFALCVTVPSLNSAEQRQQVIRRRLEFDRDPGGFIDRWQAEDARIRDVIESARHRLGTVNISLSILEQAVHLATLARVRGHRADILLVRTAAAWAALLEKEAVDSDDVRQVASFVLPHRIDSFPFSSELELDNLSQETLEESGEENGGEDEDGLDLQVPGAAAAGSIVFDFLKKKAES